MSLPSPLESPPSLTFESDLAAARSVLDERSEFYRARYGHAIFDLQAVPDDGGGWRLEGRVLLRAQLDEAVKRLGSVFAAAPRIAVDVLSDPSVETRWAAVRARVADVFRAPEGEHSSELSTQARDDMRRPARMRRISSRARAGAGMARPHPMSCSSGTSPTAT